MYMEEIKALVHQKRHRLIINISDIHHHFREVASRFVIFSICLPRIFNRFFSIRL